MKLKVCGMKYSDNIKRVARLKPDYLGFIFYDKSSRYFMDSEIPEIASDIQKVGVFVNAGIKKVIETIKHFKLDVVQLHGNETPEYCDALKKSNIEIIKVFSIKDHFDFTVLESYENVCNYFLFDTKGKLPGGNGYTFNWDILSNYTSTKPYFLSGGIGIDEVDKLNAFKNSTASEYCHTIDVNSKFEIEPGLKQIELLEQLKTKLK